MKSPKIQAAIMDKYHIQQYPPSSIQDRRQGDARDDGQLPLRAFLDIIIDNFWFIFSIALTIALLGICYAYLNKPMYESNMLIHVEDDRPSESKNLLGEMASTFEIKAAAASEMELLRSRLVVSRAVDNLRLYIDVHPKYFPLVGASIAGWNKKLSSPGLFGYGGYSWGAEKIFVTIFNVPNAFINREFVITTKPNGLFILQENEENIAWQGKVGTTNAFQSKEGIIELRVELADANPGTQFILRRSSRLTIIAGVQKALAIVEQGKQSGVIGVAYRGSDPILTNKILSEIGQEYIRQNRARKTEEAEKSLSFLDTQLPDLKLKLERSEATYNQFRNRHGTIDLNEEAKLSLQRSSASKTKLIDLQQKKTELKVRFADEHPILLGINSQIREMNEEILTVAEHIKQLPMLEQELVRLTRDVKINTDLYTALLNTGQHLRLITAGKMSNVRLVDAPMIADDPITQRYLIILLSGALGLFLGVVSAFIKTSLNQKINNPEEIERMFDVPVFAAIPHSKKLKELSTQMINKFQNIPLLAYVSSNDIAIESLRTFCTALQFSMAQSKNNIVLMSGATPGLGKTFVSVNLAAIIATTGKRVLLIDADLRRGHLHQYFGVQRKNGLFDLIAANIRPEHGIHRNVMANMDFISTGMLQPNPSDLLLRPRFSALLELLSTSYDIVFIDTTPILAVSDTLIIGPHVGAIYIMTRSGVTTADEIKEALKRLSQAGLSAKGVIFNDLKLRPGRYGYGYVYGDCAGIQETAETSPMIDMPSGLR